MAPVRTGGPADRWIRRLRAVSDGHRPPIRPVAGVPHVKVPAKSRRAVCSWGRPAGRLRVRPAVEPWEGDGDVA